MFISGRSYGNNLKYKAFYVCMSFMLMALFSTIFTVKPAFATDSNPDDKNPHGIFSGSVKCPGAYIPKQDKEEKDSGWWGCGYRSGLYGSLEFAKGIDPVITCHSGRKAEFKTKTENITYKLGHCVEGTSSTNKSVVEKNAVALADKAGPQDKLVNLIVSKIETSPWYLGLSDADKIAAGCKYQSLPGAPSGASEKGWFCDDAAKKKLAKMLIGTCIASAIRTVAKRPDGQDKSNEQIDKLFTDCIAKNSGLDKDTVNNNKAPIAWDDIKKDVDTSGSAATEESKADEDKNSCGLSGMGWAICPAMTLMGGIADQAYNTISMFLDISPKIFSDDSSTGGAKQAWSFFRDIANVIFVLLFLWVIFSQVSSIGISNYGIKKVLPKLIVGAVLVNLSFYICQLAVDLSNILGFTLKEALEGAVSGVGGSSSNSAIASGLGAAVAGILVLTGTVLFAALAVSIPTLLSLMLVLLVVLVILIVRQAAIVLLISIAPLAFAAWLLPNTESLFKKWVSMFRGLLMVFPIISLLYGAGKLAGAILMTTATSDPNDTAITMQFAGLAASILPLGATPFVLQSSLNSLGNIGAKIGRMGANAHSRFAGNVKSTAKGRTDNSIIGDTKRKYSDFMNRKRASMRAGDTRAKIDNSRFGQFMGWDKGGARARATVAKAFESDVENASTMLQGMTSGKIADIANGTTVESKAMRAAAIDHIMANGSFTERMTVLSSLKGTDASIKQRAIKAAYAKKDNNIIGNGFGDAILEDKVGNMTDLENMMIDNAASGNLQAEHLVQNAAATEWIADTSIKSYTNNTNKQAKKALNNFISTAKAARSNPNTAKNINGKIDSTFRNVGA